MSELQLNEGKSNVFSGGLPLVSIIITSYNYEKFLRRTIDSVLQQTYPAKEIIVVDDGSTDSSCQIMHGYGNRITSLFQKNRGMTSATNAGFFASRGEIIFLLDSDDTFFPHKVQEMVNYFLKVMPQTPDALIFHRLQMTSEDGTILYVTPKMCTVDGQKKNGLFEKLSDPETAYRYLQKWRFLPFFISPTSGISLTKSLAERLFPLPENSMLSQDQVLNFGSELLGTIYGTSQVLGSYLVHGKNVSLTQTWSHNEKDRFQLKENFINDILQTMNKKRIASFFESRHARLYFKSLGSTKGLLKLSYKVPARCFCWEAVWFSIRTLWLCLKIALGIKKKGPRLKKKAKLLAKIK
jgi:glycosyltransferase involved in cell wall biosynthesis